MTKFDEGKDRLYAAMAANDERELSRDVYDLKDVVWKHRERILLEDDMGGKYEIWMARVIGAATDDPGLVLKIAPVR